MVKEYETNPIAADSDDEKKMYRAQMRAERKAREDRISRRRSYRFAPYYKNPVTETATRMETDDKSTASTKSGRCYDCKARGHWSRDCPKKDESNKMSKNFTSVLRNFETKMHVKVDNNLSNICSPVGRLNIIYLYCLGIQLTCIVIFFLWGGSSEYFFIFRNNVLNTPPY